jgi:hypothetical protein
LVEVQDELGDRLDVSARVVLDEILFLSASIPSPGMSRAAAILAREARN